MGDAAAAASQRGGAGRDGADAGRMVPGRRLAELLAALRWSPEAFARHLNAFARTNRVDRVIHPKTPYKWLRGVHPQQPWPELVAALLATRAGHPIRPADLGWTGSVAALYAPADDGLAVPWTPTGALRAAVEVAQAGGVLDRRKFLTVAGAALTVPAHEWLVSPPTRADITGAGRIQLTGDTVGQLETITAQLRRMDDEIGSTPVLDLARAHTGHITGLLSDGRSTDAVGRRMHAALAEILRLTGWLSYDASQHADAQRYFLAALRAARTAGDDALGANIVAFMSCQAKDIGRTRDAVTLAATAAAGHPHATGRTRAILALRAAEASAHADDPTAVRQHVDTAFDHLGDNPPSYGEPDWSYWMNPTQAHGQAGYAYLTLGDHPRAQHHLHAAAHLRDDTASREGVLQTILLATSYAQAATPDLHQAVATGDHALHALTDSVASPRCTGYLSTLVNGLGAHRQLAVVRDFTDRARPHLLGADSVW
jgi:hypothetical protein